MRVLRPKMTKVNGAWRKLQTLTRSLIVDTVQ